MTAPDFSPAAIQQERARVLGLLEGTTPGKWSYQHGWGIQVWSQEGVGLLIYAEAGTLANVKDQDLMAAAPALARKYADALGELERLREALAFYGAEEHWRGPNAWSTEQGKYLPSVARDCGDIARAALASAPEERP